MKQASFQMKRILMSSIAVLLSITCIQAQTKVSISRDVPLSMTDMAASLSKAPMEFSTAAQTDPLLLNLPLPDGNERIFKVVESPIMAPDFAALYPTFKTYSIVASDNPQVIGRMTVTPYGLNAFIFLESGTMGIRPRDLLNPKLHEVYTGSGDMLTLTGLCQFDELRDSPIKTVAPPAQTNLASITNGATRRTYELAIVTTAEFEDANGNSTATASAVVTASVNAIQLIYDKELSVRFTLLTPFIFSDPATDDFDPTSGLGRTVMAAQSIASHFAIGTYDIGHVLHDQDQSPALHGGGGVAGLGVVCDGSSSSISGTGPNKAAGWSGSFDNTSSGWYGLFAHEMGHMFNMPHTFNGSGAANCTSNISSTTAYEIGSGNSIMSYNGLCDAAQNITSGGTADQYFHANSLDRAVTLMGTISCQTSVSTTNTPPVVNPNPCGGAYTIPVGTPFTLTGSGTDANGDVIYYSWEQYDEDGAGVPTQGFIGAIAGASTIAPLFRSFPPTTSPSRTFPQISSIVANGYSTDFEPLPTVARTLNFRLTGRDYNTNGGGIHSIDMAVTVSGAAFSVTAPNGGQTLSAGSATTVTWDVGGTTGYCTLVNIKLSTDGGYTYPYTLATGTANDGTESVTLPAGLVNVSTARIKVESANNTCVVFFDISNANFTVTSTCNAPSTTIASTTSLTTTVGNASLNLGLTNNIGTVVTSFAGSITTSDNSGNLVFLDNTPAACATTGNSIKYDTYSFSVDVTGSYEIAHGGAFGTVINLYSSSFTGTNCTNHLSSSATRPTGSGSISLNGSLTATLTAGQLYVIMVSSFSSSLPTLDFSYSITFPTKPMSANIYNGVILPTGYSYTYAALNTATNNVAAVSATSNFTSLAVGSYQIYGAAYYSGSAPPDPATPASWVGSSLSSILSGSTCQLFSSVTKPVTVTAVLPVELLNLQATPAPQPPKGEFAVLLTWQTANEVNNKGFQVERRQATGDKWDVLGFVAPQPPKGAFRNYEFLDVAPRLGAGGAYYRLRQIDYNGKETLSKIVNATLDKPQRLKVYPNPVANTLTVETFNTGDYQVLNLLGQQVLSGQQKPLSGVWGLDVSPLPQGTYIFKVGTEQAKFVKQ